MYLACTHHNVVRRFKASVKIYVFFIFEEKDEKAGAMCLMKSRAYGPSHDRIITPNACSQHFKAHFIPEPAPRRASDQSRWPDLNQVLPPVLCDVPHPRLYSTSEESAASELVLCKIMGVKPQRQHVQTRSFSVSHASANEVS